MSYLAVFDWNATLFDDNEACLAGTNAVMAFFNLPEISIEKTQETFSFPLIHFYERNGLDADTYLAHVEETGQIFLRTYEAAARECGLRPGAWALLDWLREREVRCIVLSNHLQGPLERDVIRTGAADYMAHISGNTDYATITHTMNKRERLADYMEAHGYAPEQAFIIGDSHEEPELARNLGLIGISLSGGLLSVARLKKCNPHHLVHDLADVPAILAAEWGLAL